MEPTRFETSQITLAGMSFFGDPFRLSGGWTEENEIGRLWSRFMAYLERHGHEIRHLAEQGVAYELHVGHDQTPDTGESEVLVGVHVQKVEGLPLQLCAKVLPQVRYAVFTLGGPEIGSDWSTTIFQEWKPPEGYEPIGSYGLQRYDKRFKGVDHMDESVLEVYVPLRPIDAAGDR